MQTNLIQTYQVRDEGQEAERILRACVHCGFCNATCPTYQVLGDELDGPRGRIYQIKQLLEGQPVTEETRKHLDRCLTCRACETTCPSGVEYHRLLDIGRALVKEQVPRSRGQRLYRKGLLVLFSRRVLFKMLLNLGQGVKCFLPAFIRRTIPESRKQKYNTSISPSGTQKVLLLEGCVQDALDPNINSATRVMFSALGIECVSRSQAVCCGAMSFHVDEVEQSKQQARANIDAWWSLIRQQQVRAIIVNASGCGVFAKDYVTLLKGDVNYAEKASAISNLVRDPVEFLLDLDWSDIKDELKAAIRNRGDRVVFHPPCTLQHGQKLSGVVEGLLTDLGVALSPLRDAHLCCGSAGTYSLFQPELSSELKGRKLESIRATGAKVVLSANIGCQTHLSTNSEFSVIHWLDYLAEVLTEARS